MSAAEAEASPPGTRVLIVEDDETHRYLLVLTLQDAGYLVDDAGDGEAALALAAARPPDLVVLDRHLPLLDGDAVCQRLKADRPSLPVLMLTGASSIHDRLTGFAAGADDYLAKPYDQEELLARLAVFDRLRRAEGAARQRAAELTVLLDLMHALTAETEPRAVLRGAARAAAALVPVEGVISSLVEPEGWRSIEHVRDGEPRALDIRGQSDEGLLGHVLRHRQPYRFEDAAADPLIDQARALGIHVRHGLLAPLIGRDGAVIAVLGLYNRRDRPAFTAADERVSMALAAQAALALDNARLLEAERARAAEAAAATIALRASQAQLLQARRLAAVGTLAAGVAHELNQPLMVIRGQTQMLLADQALPPAVRRGLERAERQTEKMAVIIDHLRALARPAPLARAPVSLNDLARGALLLQEQHLSAAGIIITLNLHEPAPRVLAAGGEIEQAILHLLANAHDALVGRGGRVTIATGQTDATAWLSVSDDGPGIPPATLPRVFEPFFTTKPVGQGTGLGLSLALAIAESHGGALDVASLPGQGATFTLRLPTA